MKKMKLVFALSALVALNAPPVFADQGTATSPDNTKVNKQERKGVTADQQKENASDRKISQKIRRALVKDKSLSQYGHNVKIVTANGMVTLKGPVRDEQEKQTVEKTAAKMVGKDKVTSELTIAPSK